MRGALPCLSEVRNHSRIDVKRRHFRAHRRSEAPERVGNGEWLDRLHGIEVVSLRLVHEIESRPDHRDALDWTPLELPAVTQRGERLLESEIDAQ